MDASGNAYLGGWTQSSDFPTTTGAYETSAPGGSAYVTKVNPVGGGKIYSTYIGQSARGFGIAVDSSGSAHIAGGFAYASTNFPALRTLTADVAIRALLFSQNSLPQVTT